MTDSSLFDTKQVRRAFSRAAASYDAAAHVQRNAQARLLESLDYLDDPALARTPPHGPLRRFLGQFIEHDIPVELRAHWPHIWQSNKKPLVSFSSAATGFSSRS